jgi:hypothetical protein
MATWIHRVALVGALAAAALTTDAHAQSAADVAAARELFVAGSKLSKEGRWEEAKERFAKSLALKPAPITLFSLGIAQQHSGELVEALESFRAFLIARDAATTDYRQPAEQAVAELERRVARIQIRIDPPNANGLRVRIDDVDVNIAALDLPRLVNPGHRTFRAQADGYEPAISAIDVAEGQSGDITLSLAPVFVDEATATVAAPDAIVSPPEQGGTFPILPVSLMGGGALVFGVGLTVGIIGLGEASDAPAAEGPEADAARTKGIVADVMMGVGGAAVGLGLVLLIVALNDDGSDTIVALGDDGDTVAALKPWAAPGGAGIAVSF